MIQSEDLYHVIPVLVLMGVSFYHFASGRVFRGTAVLILSAALMDSLAFLAWIRNERGGTTLAFLSLLYLAAFLELAGLVYKRFKRKTASWRRRRQELFERAGSMFVLGNIREAVGVLKKIHKNDPWDPSPLVWLAYCYLEQRKVYYARRALKRAHLLDKQTDWDFMIMKGFLLAAAGGQANPRIKIYKKPQTKTLAGAGLEKRSGS